MVTDYSFIELFRQPARDRIIESLTNMNRQADELEIIIEKALDKAIDKIKKYKHHPKFPFVQPEWISLVYNDAFFYVQGVLRQDKKIANFRTRIESYGSLFVVGAGISFEAKLPLSKHLDDILNFLGSVGYEELRNNKETCLKFKTLFKKISDEKKPSTSHKTLCLNLGGKIQDIISLNWDDLIERASDEMNVEISVIDEENKVKQSPCLWKFHGSVANIKNDNKKGIGGWVFPDEEGFVFESFLKYLYDDDGLKSKLFVVVVAGYSESDENINDIVKILEEKPPRPTVRIGPDLDSLNDQNFLVGPSDYILPKLLN